jgi:hypothetical protein
MTLPVPFQSPFVPWPCSALPPTTVNAGFGEVVDYRAKPSRHQDNGAIREALGRIRRPIIVIPGPDPGIPADSVGWGDPRIRSGDDDDDKSDDDDEKSDDDDEKSRLHPHPYPEGNGAKPDADTFMESGPSPPERALIPQRPVHLTPGRLDRALRRIQRVAHALPGIVEAASSPLPRAFLVAGGQTRGHQCTGGNQQRYTHKNLMDNEQRRNEPSPGRFHPSGHVRVGRA